MPAGVDSVTLGLNTTLRSAVQQKFASALRSGELLFSESQLTILRTKQGIPFQLRYCPALSKKPKDNVPVQKDEKAASKPKRDPFEDPSPELLISQTRTGSHILLLNKFPIIPNHFILATKLHKPQTHLLDQEDLALTHTCLRAWREDADTATTTTTTTTPSTTSTTSTSTTHAEEGQLLAFFNSGEHSGASQPHRHIQFVPVSDMRINNSKWQHPDTFDWNLLVHSMKTNFHACNTVSYTSNARLPIRHFATTLEDDESAASLHAKYVSLLKLAIVATRKKPAGDPFVKYDDVDADEAKIEDDNGEISFSYNLAMTTEILAICPRRAESASIPGLDSSLYGVSVNGTILGGTLLVKEQQEWDALCNRPGALDSILETVAFPIAQPDQSQDSQRPLISPNTIPSTHL